MPWFEGLEVTLALMLVALAVLLVFLAGARRLHTWQPRVRAASDRRDGQRAKPMSKLRVFKRQTHTYVGQVRDIHHGGMRMHAVQPMSDTESLELEISALPKSDTAQLIPVRGRKVWQEANSAEGSVEIGFRFTRLSRTARQAIEALSTLAAATPRARRSDMPGT